MLTAVVTIVIFLVMISLHEFGHFIVGKLTGMCILEFSIGMGPAIFKKQKGETLYSIRALPIGGFCRFDGEDVDSQNPRAFYSQAPWKRFLTLLAGAAFNVLFGFVLFIILMSQMSGFRTNTIQSVVENSYLAESGVQAGDRIVNIDGKGISFYNDITLYTSNLTGDESFDITVKRGDEKLTYNIRPTERRTRADYEEDGITYTTWINGAESVEFYPYGEDIVKDESLIGTSQESTDYIIGFSPAVEEKTFTSVISQSWYMTKYVVKLIYQSLFDMITGKVGMEQLSGPVGIVTAVDDAVNQGEDRWIYILNLTGLLAINLGVFNLLPIPGLDGGKIIFVLIEMVRRKPIPVEKEGLIHGIGLILLFALILFISFNDIYRLIRG